MLIPTFNTTRSIASLGSVTVDHLGWILRNDHILTQRTEAVRSATDPRPAQAQAPRRQLRRGIQTPTTQR